MCTTSSSPARLRIITSSSGDASAKRRSAWYWVRAWWPVAAGICVIALESTSYLGADHTTGPFRWIWEHLFGPVPNARWDTLHYYIRKSGHFLGYGTMGLLWLRAWWMTLPRVNFMLDAVLALFGTAIVAIADESHQSFLANRTGVPSDVFLDCSGAFVLLLLAYLILRITTPKAAAHN